MLDLLWANKQALLALIIFMCVFGARGLWAAGLFFSAIVLGVMLFSGR